MVTTVTLAPLIYAGGGANELMTGTRKWNSGIAARGSIYVANDNKVYAFRIPVGGTLRLPQLLQQLLRSHRLRQLLLRSHPLPQQLLRSHSTATATAAHSHCHGNCHANGNSDGNGDCNRNFNCDCASKSDANTLGLYCIHQGPRLWQRDQRAAGGFQCYPKRSAASSMSSPPISWLMELRRQLHDLQRL